MKANYVHEDTLTATDYVELNKNNELLMSYNQALLKENQELKADYGNKSQVERDMLQQENQILKKQLEKSNTALDTHNELIEYMKNKQNEFIDWLIENESLDDYCNETTFTSIREKYEEIIGGKDGN